MKQLLYPVAFALGAIVPLQALISNQLKAHTGGSTIIAALISFVVGSIVLIVLAIVLKEKFPTYGELTNINPWLFIGGVLGCSFLCGSIILTSTLGSATMMSLIISGQIISALIFDTTGFLGTPVKELSFVRIIGAVLVIAGVVLVSFPKIFKH